MRLILKAHYLANSAPLFSKPRVTDIYSIIFFSVATFMYYYHHNLLSSSFSSLRNLYSLRKPINKSFQLLLASLSHATFISIHTFCNVLFFIFLWLIIIFMGLFYRSIKKSVWADQNLPFQKFSFPVPLGS